MSDPTDSGGYASMPADQWRGPQEQGPRTAPAPVLTAVRLMFARAALSLLGLLALLATKSTLKEQILKSKPTVSGSQIDTLLSAAIGIGVVVGLVFIVLYVLLALQVRKGKNWARIVTWVLAGLGVLSALTSLAQPEPLLTRILSLIGAVIDVAVIVLLAQRPSSAYFSKTG